MKKIMTYFVFFVMVFSFAQNLKKQIYLDENGKAITKEEFAKTFTQKGFYYKIIETDSAKIGKIIKLFDSGELEPETAKKIRTETENISKIKIDSTDVLVINFFYKEDAQVFNKHCLNFYKKDSSYKNFFKKNRTLKQVFVLEENYNYQEKNLFVDEKNNIKTLAFPDGSSCTSYIIIFPDNSYIRDYGEHKYQTILDYLKKYIENKK